MLNPAFWKSSSGYCIKLGSGVLRKIGLLSCCFMCISCPLVMSVTSRPLYWSIFCRRERSGLCYYRTKKRFFVFCSMASLVYEAVFSNKYINLREERVCRESPVGQYWQHVRSAFFMKCARLIFGIPWFQHTPCQPRPTPLHTEKGELLLNSAAGGVFTNPYDNKILSLVWGFKRAKMVTCRRSRQGENIYELRSMS